MSFEHRDENKTCSACREWLKEWDSEREWESVNFEHRNETKVVQHVKSDWMSVRVRKCEIVRESEREWECDPVPSFCLTFRHFFYSDQLLKLIYSVTENKHFFEKKIVWLFFVLQISNYLAMSHDNLSWVH